ncbi:MAG: site-specific DNA-methyltransferase [Spirochaetaceae bacterium]|nr:MAG: site-specific DNA-methyltransferase [Spirochaetaceae bacterium]
MPTSHRLLSGSATDLSALPDASVHLIVTSPPYPMISMWDDVFSAQDPAVGAALAASDGAGAFARMHAVLDAAWAECVRVLRPGGILCVNVGDAVRTIGESFRLYPNHARISQALGGLGLQALPLILWRKSTNAPNKFMGSGTLPGGAYVTLEHEYVLVFRCGGLRRFTAEERVARRRSAFFWEERNRWFSDVWDFHGTRQNRDAPAAGRDRSGAFPLELAYRLICMFSICGDTVLDPFAGTGTTTLAAIAAGRHSIGVERDAHLVTEAAERAVASRDLLNQRVTSRLTDHAAFLRAREEAGKPAPQYHNEPHDVPVVTRQETELELRAVDRIVATDPVSLEATYRAISRSSPAA